VVLLIAGSNIASTPKASFGLEPPVITLSLYSGPPFRARFDLSLTGELSAGVIG